MGLNGWIKLKIIVKDSGAKFFINGSKRPALIVNDLKHGQFLRNYWTLGGYRDRRLFSRLKDSKTQMIAMKKIYSILLLLPFIVSCNGTKKVGIDRPYNPEGDIISSALKDKIGNIWFAASGRVVY